MLDAILFDMDGTLVPMDTDSFTKGYFKFLCKKLENYNIDPQNLVSAIWAGTKEMVKNDGSMTNEDRFWIAFEKFTGHSKDEINDDCLDFYSNEFKQSKMFTKDNELAKVAVELAKTKASKVILSTNPIFPYVGQVTRMGFVGLKEEDFDLITSYESDSYCKPNPKYFESICERMNISPENSLIIGNDVYEDMYAGSVAGLKTFLVTDCIIETDKFNYEGPKGTFEDLIEFLKSL